ncbi:MAG: response regulator [Desulfobacteraceae bacterium]|nr:MAG: response regulator [Desulfobacteraceae bacterium]
MEKKDESVLNGKRVLIADDEPDVLETLEELLSMCVVVKASSFEEARKQLETGSFDFAVLDIMGINGYKLLEIAADRNITAVMLTAHALTPEDTVRSFKEGAASYVPKDEINNITTYLADIVDAKKRGKSLWWRWMDRMEKYYDAKFGPDWKKSDKEFWDKFTFYT